VIACHLKELEVDHQAFYIMFTEFVAVSGFYICFFFLAGWVESTKNSLMFCLDFCELPSPGDFPLFSSKL
jgi:hypothetical protein